MRSFIAIVVAAAALSTTTARAARYTFDLTGSRSATFTLDSSAPSFSSVYQSIFDNVSGTFGGAPGIATSIGFGDVSFINSLDISGTSLGFTQFGGPLLISGPTSNPVFTPGSYTLSGIVSGTSTLTIAAATAAVPEPSAWALMIGGFGLIGTVRRRLPRTVVAA